MPSTQPMPAATCSAVTSSVRRDLRIGAVREQQLHQDDVARLRGAQERRRAVLVEPLVREHRARLRAVLHARVDVGALVEQELDELQVVHVALADRIVARLDVAVVGGEIERRPAALVGEVRIGAVLEQVRAELVVAVLRRDEQRAPAVAGGLVDVGAGGEQHLDRLEIVGARRKHQRRQPAAVFRLPARVREAGRRSRRIVLIVAQPHRVQRRVLPRPAAAGRPARRPAPAQHRAPRSSALQRAEIRRRLLWRPAPRRCAATAFLRIVRLCRAPARVPARPDSSGP